MNSHPAPRSSCGNETQNRKCPTTTTFRGLRPVLLLATAWLAWLGVAAAGSAQETKPATNPPPRRAQPTPILSPEQLSDGSVKFRYRAPKATEVKVSGQFGKDAPMTKDTQ